MCGNGIRCVAKYVYDHGLTDQKEISVESGAGIKYLKLTVEDGVVTLVRVDMGEPILTPAEIPVKADGDKVVDEPIEVGGRLWTGVRETSAFSEENEYRICSDYFKNGSFHACLGARFQ